MFDILTKVKSDLGVTGTYQDATIKGYIDEVKEYMLDAGVHEKIVNSSVSSGLISRGVADLWTYGSGNASLSPYFMQRVIQLIYRTVEDVQT